MHTLSNLRNILQELIESAAPVAVACRATTQRRAYGAMRHCEATAVGSSHIVIHELYAVGAVIGAVGGESDFQAANRLNHRLGVEL